MFSIIITIIAIILAVALALAVLYYGGDSSQKAAARASAATLINQAGQIEAAGTIATLQGVGWPTDAPYFSQPFLETMPVPPKSAYTTGAPAATDWEYYVPSPHTRHFVLREKVSRDVCMAVNKEFGMIGIPAMWTGKDLVQCFGAGVRTGTDEKLSYTFFFDPHGASAAEDAAALAQSHQEAIIAGVASPSPGYPRLCPNDTVITSGVCTEDTTVAAPPASEPDKEGFFVVTATSGDSNPTLVSQGFMETCPAGAIDPTGPSATPVVTNPGEPFNVDGVMRTGWMAAPDYNYIYDTYLTRSWCFPAMKSEAYPAGPLASGMGGGVTDVTLAPAIPNANPMDWTWASAAATSFIAKGQAWSVVATSFEADLWRTDNGDNPWMVGDKLAVGRGKNLASTYYGPVPTLSFNGTNYAGERGTIVFTPTPPVSPRKLEVSWPGGTGTTVPFPDTTVGTASSPLPITFRNISTQPVAMDTAPTLYGSFAIGSNACPSSLGVGASCVISVVFTPTTEGWQSGGISIDIGGSPATPSFYGTAGPVPAPGYWLIQGQTYFLAVGLKSLGFSTTCPAGAIDPTSPAAQPLPGLPAGETLNADAVMKQQWSRYSNPNGYENADVSGVQRLWCIPAMNIDVHPLSIHNTNYEERDFIGQDDYSILPATNQWYSVITETGIATATIKAKDVAWTVVAVAANFRGSNPNFTPADGQAHTVEKVAIGRTPWFTGTYYAGGPTLTDKNGTAYRKVGFVRYGDADPSVPVELVFDNRYAYTYAASIGQPDGLISVRVKNMSTDTVEITGQGVVGGSSSPFNASLDVCSRYLAPGDICVLSGTYTATQTGNVYDQFAITTPTRTYIVGLAASSTSTAPPLP